MKKRFTGILLILLVSFVTVYAIVTIQLQVQSQGDNASLTWTVSGISLTTQQRFSIQRKSINTSYQEIATVATSDNISTYQFTDKAAYKVSDVIYTYKVLLVDVNNSYYVYGSSKDESAYLSISGVKKTLGSIKAMFR